MIRAFKQSDLPVVMKIWFETNVNAHRFISEEYWTSHYEAVKAALPEAELYVYEEECGGRIAGFIGLTDNYIAGLFVKAEAQSKGIGTQLIDYAKRQKETLQLSVYKKNVRAAAFYQREGFRIQSENTDCGTGEAELLMIWNR